MEQFYHHHYHRHRHLNVPAFSWASCISVETNGRPNVCRHEKKRYRFLFVERALKRTLFLLSSSRLRFFRGDWRYARLYSSSHVGIKGPGITRSRELMDIERLSLSLSSLPTNGIIIERRRSQLYIHISHLSPVRFKSEKTREGFFPRSSICCAFKYYREGSTHRFTFLPFFTLQPWITLFRTTWRGVKSFFCSCCCFIKEILSFLIKMTD